MNAITQKQDRYILFLEMSDRPSETFFKVTEYMSKWNISVVPVSPSSLKGLRIVLQANLLVITSSLRTKTIFDSLRETFLDFVLLRQKINLFHISSFSPIEIAHRLEKKQLYNHYQLPVHLEEVCHHMATEIYARNSGARVWPGGRRAKLPLLG